MARGPKATSSVGPDRIVDVTFAIDPVSRSPSRTSPYPPESEVCANPPPALGIVKDNDAPVTTIDLGDGTTVDLPTANEGDTVTYTLTYNTNGIPQTNGVVTDVLPEGVTYVDGSASSNDEFTFVEYDAATRTLALGSARRDARRNADLRRASTRMRPTWQQPLINVATIVTRSAAIG